MRNNIYILDGFKKYRFKELKKKKKKRFNHQQKKSYETNSHVKL